MAVCPTTRVLIEDIKRSMADIQHSVVHNNSANAVKETQVCKDMQRRIEINQHTDTENEYRG